MSQGANVRSVDALKEFKLALVAFGEDARNALSSADMEIRRVRDFVTRDQLGYWQAQVKRRDQDVAMAKSDLSRRKLSQMNSDAVSDTDQKEALRIALRRLHEAEEKVQVIKRWVPVLEHAVNEYHSSSQPLGDRLTGSFLNSIAAVERMIGALDAYLAMAPPASPSFEPAGGGVGAAVASQAAAPAEAVPAPDLPEPPGGETEGGQS